MTPEEMKRAAQLLRNYANACENILYKHGNHKQDRMDSEDLAEKLDSLADCSSEGRND